MNVVLKKLIFIATIIIVFQLVVHIRRYKVAFLNQWMASYEKGIIEEKAKSKIEDRFDATYSKVFFVTYDDSDLKNKSNNLVNLLKTIAAQDEKLIILGINKTNSLFNQTVVSEQQLTLRRVFWKLVFFQKLVVTYSQQIGARDDDLMLFLDGWDVLMQGTVPQIRKSFNNITNLKRGVIFGAEKTCWPFKMPQTAEKTNLYDYWGYWSPEKPHVYLTRQNICGFLRSISTDDTKNDTYPFLNAGLMIGDIKTLRNYLTEALTFLRINNETYRKGARFEQTIHQLLFAQQRHKYNVLLDKYTEIFFNGNQVSEADMDRLNVNNTTCAANYMDKNGLPPPVKQTGNRPVFLHFSGYQFKPYLSSCAKEILGKKYDEKLPYLDLSKKYEIKRY